MYICIVCLFVYYYFYRFLWVPPPPPTPPLSVVVVQLFINKSCFLFQDAGTDCCILLICRKGLVEVFDKLEQRQLEEGPRLSKLVRQMHKDRYIFNLLPHVLL